MNADDWPAMHKAPLRSLLAGDRGNLATGIPSFVAFVCAPSRFQIERGAHDKVSPDPNCDDAGVLTQAIPMYLAFHTNKYEAIVAAGRPLGGSFAWGERASSS